MDKCLMLAKNLNELQTKTILVSNTKVVSLTNISTTQFPIPITSSSTLKLI